MLVEFSVENFLSYKEKQTFSLKANVVRTNKEKTFGSSKDSLLKSIVFYGSNASGKSNMINSLLFSITLIKGSGNLNSDSTYFKDVRTPFKLDFKFLESKPSLFEYVFYLNNKKYKYGFSCNAEGILDEYLYVWDSKIYDRRTKYIDKKYEKKWAKINPLLHSKTLFLSKAVQNKDVGILLDIYNYFKSDFNFGFDFRPLPFSRSAKLLYDNKYFKKFVTELLRGADFGKIKEIRVEKIENAGVIGNIRHNSENNTSELEEVKTDVYNLEFIHLNDHNQDITFEYKEESVGTQKTIMLLESIYNVLKNGRILIVDELENSLHPEIVKLLINLFYGKLNKRNAQLIFTTHNTSLLNNDLFRKDQIYICNKKIDQSSELNSLSDYDVRQDDNFERIYTEGRLRGVPVIDNRIIEDLDVKEDD